MISLKLLEQLRVGTPVVIGRQINGILQLGHVERFYLDLNQKKNFVIVKGMNEHYFDFDDLIFHSPLAIIFHKDIWNEILKNRAWVTGELVEQIELDEVSWRARLWI